MRISAYKMEADNHSSDLLWTCGTTEPAWHHSVHRYVKNSFSTFAPLNSTSQPILLSIKCIQDELQVFLTDAVTLCNVVKLVLHQNCRCFSASCSQMHWEWEARTVAKWPRASEYDFKFTNHKMEKIIFLIVDYLLSWKPLHLTNWNQRLYARRIPKTITWLAKSLPQWDVSTALFQCDYNEDISAPCWIFGTGLISGWGCLKQQSHYCGIPLSNHLVY